MKTVGILLFAGLSTRFGEGKQKQLSLLKGRAVFSYSIDTFLKSKEIDELIVVTNKQNNDIISLYIKEKGINAKIVFGGSTRQESVSNAIKSLNLEDDDLVIIHDGARPLITEEIIKNVIDCAKEHGCATTYLNEVDTIAKISEDETIEQFEDRNKIIKIQTPQCFKFNIINKAHANVSNLIATDDCTLVMQSGYKIKLVAGHKRLHKITTQDDLIYLEGILKND